MSEVIVITSGKGGVGKTTTTANVGTGLAQLNKKVVLIDNRLLHGQVAIQWCGHLNVNKVVVVNDGTIKAKANGVPAVDGDGTYTKCTVTQNSVANELSSGSGSDEYTVRIEASKDNVAATQVEEKWTVTFDYVQVTNQGSN